MLAPSPGVMSQISAAAEAELAEKTIPARVMAATKSECELLRFMVGFWLTM
jgi:hypothetical protein